MIGYRRNRTPIPPGEQVEGVSRETHSTEPEHRERSWQHWTPEDIEQLRRLRLERGLTVPEIAARMPGRTLKAIENRLALLKITVQSRRNSAAPRPGAAAASGGDAPA